MSDINVLIEETLFSEGVGEHFKKHWKKYAAGAGVLGALSYRDAIRRHIGSPTKADLNKRVKHPSSQEKKTNTSSNQEKKTSTEPKKDSKPTDDDYNDFKNTTKNSVNKLKQLNQDIKYKADQRKEEEKILNRRLNNSMKRGTFGIPREHPKSSNARLKRDFHGESLIGNILHKMFIL